MNIPTKFDLGDTVHISTMSEFYSDNVNTGTVDMIRTLHGTNGGHEDGAEYFIRLAGDDYGSLWIFEDDLLTEGECEDANQSVYEDRIARTAL